jgi:hypothetical protein
MNEHHLCCGRCHCAAVAVDLRLSKPPAVQRVRACQCGFCKSRGVRTIADAGGHAIIRPAGPDTLIRYRFDLKTADYLLCRICGTYIGAVQSEAGGAIGVINVGGLSVPDFEGRSGDPVSYDGEGVEQRRARRRTYWMPVVIEPRARP